jgi:cytochrome c oxidase assembly protein subunit 15
MIKRLGALLLLGGLQGAVGYWMVRSGVHKKEDYQTRPRVSPYRLSVHLMMATFIYMGLFYNGLKLLVATGTPALESGRKSVKNIRFMAILLIKCMLFNIFTGALVAGIDAGKV